MGLHIPPLCSKLKIKSLGWLQTLSNQERALQGGGPLCLSIIYYLVLVKCKLARTERKLARTANIAYSCFNSLSVTKKECKHLFTYEKFHESKHLSEMKDILNCQKKHNSISAHFYAWIKSNFIHVSHWTVSSVGDMQVYVYGFLVLKIITLHITCLWFYL